MSKRRYCAVEKEEIRETLTVIVQCTQVTYQQLKKAVEDKKSTATDWSKLIAEPNVFDYKWQEKEINALREWSWELEKCLSSVDSVNEAYMKDLKEPHDKPNEKLDMDLATGDEKTRCIKLYGLLASLMRGRSLQVAKAVEDSNGFDAWRSLNKALKPISKARGLAPLGAATNWLAFSKNSAIQPLEEVSDETAKARTTVQEELKSATLVRCV